MEGLSGAGKSSVYDELIRRGYRAISTDRAWKRRGGAGTTSIWDPQKAVGELERTTPDVLFVCGSAGNRDDFLPYFTTVFNLRIGDDTMRRRLEERTNNDFGKRLEELELMLRLNRSGARPADAVDVEATRPLEDVVDEVLRLAGCGDAEREPTPWSRGESPIGESFVIPAGALPGSSDGRDAVARLEYAWAGSLLPTLLQYLREHGVDLGRSGHDDAAIVLTPDHRARYLARLDPSDYDEAVLRRWYEERKGTTAEGVGYALLDGIAFLRDTLAPLDPALVAVLLIG